MYKRILETSAYDALKAALEPYGVIVRKTNLPASNSLMQEYAIEGDIKNKAVIDKAVELFDCAVD